MSWGLIFFYHKIRNRGSLLEAQSEASPENPTAESEFKSVLRCRGSAGPVQADLREHRPGEDIEPRNARAGSHAGSRHFQAQRLFLVTDPREPDFRPRSQAGHDTEAESRAEGKNDLGRFSFLVDERNRPRSAEGAPGSPEIQVPGDVRSDLGFKIGAPV